LVAGGNAKHGEVSGNTLVLVATTLGLAWSSGDGCAFGSGMLELAVNVTAFPVQLVVTEIALLKQTDSVIFDHAISTEGGDGVGA